jgi:hypothetical protein
MSTAHEAPDWWIDPVDGAGAMVVVTARVRPMGPRSAFTTRPMAYACLNCGEWIHPQVGAWYDPDLDRSVCARCWPESITAAPHR